MARELDELGDKDGVTDRCGRKGLKRVHNTNRGKMNG